jgi:hypothetical protein
MVTALKSSAGDKYPFVELYAGQLLACFNHNLFIFSKLSTFSNQ